MFNFQIPLGHRQTLTATVKGYRKRVIVHESNVETKCETIKSVTKFEIILTMSLDTRY